MTTEKLCVITVCMAFKTFVQKKLRDKLLIIYFFGFLLPMIIVYTLFSYNLFLDDREFDIKNLENQVSKTEILVKNEFNEALQIIYSVYINKDLTNFIKGEYQSQNEYLKERNEVFKTNTLLSQLSAYDIKYTIYTKNRKYRPDPVIKKIDKKVEDSLWYREFVNSKRTGFLYYTNRDSGFISIIRALDYRVPKENRWDNLIKADIPVNKILIHLQKFPSSMGIALISGKNDIVFSNNSYENIGYLYIQNFNEIKMLSDWSLKGWINKKNFQNYLLNRSRLKILIPIFITLLLGSFVIFKLSQSFYKRIYNLSNKMTSLKKGNFELIDIDYHIDDEITQLSNSYNLMIEEIDKLINEITEVTLKQSSIELAKNKAQLSALISQINPHYLFNVLESIRMKSIIKGENETANIIKHLSRSFRNTISSNSNSIKVKEEIQISEDFLIVQKYRFSEKLNYEFIVDDNTLNFIIPKLTIQPFIENSCIHGIEKKSTKGNIKIEVKKDNTNLIIIIDDDGSGIEINTLKQLKSEMITYSPHDDHIGFTNTYWRLKKLYKGFNLFINSELGKGTYIELNIPLLELETL